MNHNRILYSLCCWNKTEEVKYILDRYIDQIDEIDVLDEDGILFKMAISNNNPELCQALLSFFENKQHPTQEQQDALKEILEEETAFADLSKEMREVLSKHVSNDEDSDREKDLDDLIILNQNKLQALEDTNKGIKELIDTYNKCILPKGFITDLNALPTVNISPTNLTEIKEQLDHNKQTLKSYKSDDIARTHPHITQHLQYFRII